MWLVNAIRNLSVTVVNSLNTIIYNKDSMKNGYGYNKHP